MILDNLDNFETPEFTIVGSGPASIILALKLSRKDKKVLILEAGSRYYEDESQKFYDGKTVGDDYYDLKDCRLRFLGGSTGHYNGRLHPYDDIDFIDWPIKKKNLDLYLNETKEIFEIKKKFESNLSKIDNFYLDEHIMSPIRFGEKYYDSLVRDKNIFLIFNSPVQLISESDDNSNKVGSVTIINNGERKIIKIKKLIIACGGIENSRILLWSSLNSKSNFLKDYALGNYWMEHPSGLVGQFIGDEDKLNSLFLSRMELKNIYLVPNKDFTLKNKINNLRIDFTSYQNSKSDSFKHILKNIICLAPVYGKKIVEAVQKKQMVHCSYSINMQAEAKPNFDNRVSLSKNEKDDYGVPKVELHWNVKDDFFNSAEIVLKELGKQFIKNDIGRIGIDRFIYDKTLKNIQTYKGTNTFSDSIKTVHTQNVFGGYHHMGGTRMSEDKKNGVVDSNLKVHNLENLYIAGSSTFPTSGHWNPTFTIVQLTLRLADHLLS